MSYHSTKRTVSRDKWCNQCSAFTLHDVCQGRVGHCLACPERKARERGLLIRSGHSDVRVEIIPPCLCSKYDFPHYHAGSNAVREWDDAMRQVSGELEY